MRSCGRFRYERENRAPKESGNRVMTSRMPGMATGKAFDRQPGAAPEAMLAEGFHGIPGTGRLEPANVSWQEGRYAPLIEANQGNGDPAHLFGSLGWLRSLSLEQSPLACLGNLRPRLIPRSFAGGFGGSSPVALEKPGIVRPLPAPAGPTARKCSEPPRPWAGSPSENLERFDPAALAIPLCVFGISPAVGA